MILDFPRPDMHSMVLRSDDIRTMSVNDRPGDMSNAFSIGREALPITDADLAKDADLRTFIERESGTSRFYKVLIACSFHADRDEPFEEAWLKVDLERTDGVEGTGPIAWSMDPLKEITRMEVGRTFSLKGELKFGVGGLEAGGEENRKLDLELTHVAAYGILQSNPFWEFRRTTTCAIERTYELAMIVRVPRHVQARARISMQANVRRKRFGLIPYTAEFPDRASSDILLT